MTNAVLVDAGRLELGLLLPLEMPELELELGSPLVMEDWEAADEVELGEGEVVVSS